MQPDNNLGSSTLAIGVTNTGFISRALVRFDLGAIPAGSIIESATLSLVATREARISSIVRTINTHRALVFWEEGSRTGNTVATAQTGDATWNARGAGQN